MKNLKVYGISSLVVLILVLALVFPYLTRDEVTVRVTDKERVVTREDSYYLIFTEGETFKNSDCLVYFKFNSSDLYGAIKKDKTYKLSVYGWRVPLFSAYRNILSAKEIL